MPKTGKKEGDEFYKLDKEDFAAVKDELAEEQIAVVRQLVAQLDDDQLDNQVRFERYEKERLRQEATKSATTINLSDEEPSSEQRSVRVEAGTRQPDLTQEEQWPEEPEQQQQPMEQQQQEEQ